MAYKKTGRENPSCVFDLLVHVEALLESVNTSAGIDQLLLAGIEGMAIAANFNTDILLGGAYLELVAACALDGSGLVLGMDSLFHLFHLAQLYCLTKAIISQ